MACDVDNPLTGPRGASAVYGPQKGATPAMVRELDRALEVLARGGTIATGRVVADQPGAGAAGGLGAGLLWFTPARLRPGVEIVLEATGFEALVAAADLVLTGEGRTDAQTAMGKAPVGVAAVARRHGVPVLCLSGGLGDGADQVLDHGIDALAQHRARTPGPGGMRRPGARPHRGGRGPDVPPGQGRNGAPVSARKRPLTPPSAPLTTFFRSGTPVRRMTFTLPD